MFGPAVRRFGISVGRTLAVLKAAEPWSLTSLREKLIKIGAKVVSMVVTSRSK